MSGPHPASDDLSTDQKMDSLMLLWDGLLQSRHGIDEHAAQIKANYVRLMRPQAGEAFAELMQDAARLHLKWNEFLALFAVSPAQIDTLNKAAPGFFYLVSEAWWDGLILHIFRMTDANSAYSGPS